MIKDTTTGALYSLKAGLLSTDQFSENRELPILEYRLDQV